LELRSYCLCNCSAVNIFANAPDSGNLLPQSAKLVGGDMGNL